MEYPEFWIRKTLDPEYWDFQIIHRETADKGRVITMYRKGVAIGTSIPRFINSYYDSVDPETPLSMTKEKFNMLWNIAEDEY